MTWPVGLRHDLAVAADGFVVELRCSCGWGCECDDDEVLLAELVQIAEDHQHAAEATAAVLEHLQAGHVTRMRRAGGGMAMVCTCGASWPVEVTA